MFKPKAAIDHDALLRTTINTLNSMKAYRLSPRKLTTIPGSVIAGGFGDVEQARLRLSIFGAQKKIAVKRLRPSGDRNSRVRIMASLARELNIWTRLSHKNILQLEGFYYDQVHLTAAWIATPWQSSGNLLQYLEGKKPDERARLRLAQDTADGLAYLHRLLPPVCHGDLKPENTLIGENGNALLCDFGLSRIVDEHPSGLTTTQSAKLTTRYAAPELFDQGSTHTLMSDIWAWGCLLLTIMIDRFPYDSYGNPYSLLRAITVDEMPPSDLTDSRLPMNITTLLTRCWDRSPASRADAKTCCDVLQGRQHGVTEIKSVLDAQIPIQPELFQPDHHNYSSSPSSTLAVYRLSLSTTSPTPSAHPFLPEIPLPSDGLERNFTTAFGDILKEGDIIGGGAWLDGEQIELVDIPTTQPQPKEVPAEHLQVVKKLGTGSYAAVHLVQEVAPCSGGVCGPAIDTVNRREFAVKCLLKATLSQEELEIQMFEAAIHQSLPTHPNIVTFYRALQTQSCLLLVLEFVPGEDLFSALEESQDSQPQHDFDPVFRIQPLGAGPTKAPTPTLESTPNPPSAITDIPNTSTTRSLLSLLSSRHPSELLSSQRLNLISSMFAQMCAAVGACHTAGVSHRDIKPTNFMVAEEISRGERRVVVKLSDFGLATTLQQSGDMDCGSAPYMSFECRNNLAPTYATQPADVWSLGIVLINMLYHHNLWSDTAILATNEANNYRGISGYGPAAERRYVCNSFANFLDSPVQFFLERFNGMPLCVADFLANRVFCILRQPSTAAAGYKNRGERVTAADFGAWVKTLPSMMGEGAPMNILPVVPQAALAMTTTESTRADRGSEQEWATEGSGEQDLPHVSSTTKRRGKRGARRKDGSRPSLTPFFDTPVESVMSEVDSLSSLAAAVELRAAEISRTTRHREVPSIVLRAPTHGSRMGRVEKAIARLPPMPSVPPPIPPTTASVESYRALGSRIKAANALTHPHQSSSATG